MTDKELKLDTIRALQIRAYETACRKGWLAR